MAYSYVHHIGDIIASDFTHVSKAFYIRQHYTAIAKLESNKFPQEREQAWSRQQGAPWVLLGLKEDTFLEVFKVKKKCS